MLFPDSSRRARLARRHALHPDHRAPSAWAAAHSVVAMHATEPASVHLAVAARTTTARVEDVESALYDERCLVKQLAMRRTLFAFPREDLPAVWGAPSARVADQYGRALARDIERHGVSTNGDDWMRRASIAVLERLNGGIELSTRDLRAQVAHLQAVTADLGGSRWQPAGQPFAPRLLTVMNAQHRIVRAHNVGHWRTARMNWTRVEDWLDVVPPSLTEHEAYAAVVGRWLARFGPGTEADLVWWLGATKGIVRAALAANDAKPVELDDGNTGYVLPGDEAPDQPVGDWVALLPVLDSTVMGWRNRAFYLDPALVPDLFDAVGNGGTTAWVNGRVVGCWVQDDDARVRVVPLTPIASRHRAMLNDEAERLTAFLDGTVVSSIYKSRLMKSALPT